MENVTKIWEELKLPELTPKVPWFGYELGYWPDDWDEATKLTLQGRYLETGEKMKSQRTEDSPTSTPVEVRFHSGSEDRFEVEVKTVLWEGKSMSSDTKNDPARVGRRDFVQAAGLAGALAGSRRWRWRSNRV